MADNLNVDLKDDYGTFNCGKPSGFIKDLNLYLRSTKNLIKQIKELELFLA